MSVDTKTLDAAVEHHQNGELAVAVEIYQEILSHDPDNADAWHLMGVAAHQQGNAVVSVYTRDVAESKAKDATDMGREAGHPLMFTIEPGE